ncbi:hypothetical protein HDU97_000081 [Phlyctochytrium planicorne]|nr:hypothetical protein HDU97_000081 [Phlyctochytrium planicorne]
MERAGASHKDEFGRSPSFDHPLTSKRDYGILGGFDLRQKGISPNRIPSKTGDGKRNAIASPHQPRPNSFDSATKASGYGYRKPKEKSRFLNLFGRKSDYEIDSITKNLKDMGIDPGDTMVPNSSHAHGPNFFQTGFFEKSAMANSEISSKPLPPTPPTRRISSVSNIYHESRDDNKEASFFQSTSNLCSEPISQQPTPVPNPVLVKNLSRQASNTTSSIASTGSMLVRKLSSKKNPFSFIDAGFGKLGFGESKIDPKHGAKPRSEKGFFQKRVNTNESQRMPEQRPSKPLVPSDSKLDCNTTNSTNAESFSAEKSVPVLKSSTASREEEEKAKRQEDIMKLIYGKSRLAMKFHEKYDLGDLLGDGAFGFVFSATRRKDGLEIAIKFIIKSKIHRDLWVLEGPSSRVPLEVHILKSLAHPAIVRFLDYYEEDKYVLLATELHGTQWDPANPLLSPEKNPGMRQPKRHASANEHQAPDITSPPPPFKKRTSCDLFECIDAHRRIPETIGKYIFAQIALAVKYLHERNIVHRDLKDENIVIDSNYMIKIVDFGSASPIPKRREEYFTKFNGTAHFASPEIAKGEPFRGPEAELWSLGVLLFTIIYGENPFQTRAEILKGQYQCPFKLDSDSSPSGK